MVREGIVIAMVNVRRRHRETAFVHEMSIAAEDRGQAELAKGSLRRRKSSLKEVGTVRWKAIISICRYLEVIRASRTGTCRVKTGTVGNNVVGKESSLVWRIDVGEGCPVGSVNGSSAWALASMIGES